MQLAPEIEQVEYTKETLLFLLYRAELPRGFRCASLEVI